MWYNKMKQFIVKNKQFEFTFLNKTTQTLYFSKKKQGLKQKVKTFGGLFYLIVSLLNYEATINFKKKSLLVSNKLSSSKFTNNNTQTY